MLQTYADLAKDDYGYLLHINDWNRQIAREIAEQEELTLDQQAWQVIEAMRTFYIQYQLEPTMRAFVGFLKNNSLQNSALSHLADSIILHHMFPGGVLKQVCRIAGLPRPTRCFN